jgi:hypothetical protein
VVDELAGVALSCRNRDATVIALLDVACDGIRLGDADTTRELRQRAGDIATRHASPTMVWHMGVWDTGFALMEGRFDAAEQLAHDSLLVGRRLEHPYAPICFDGQLSILARERGDDEDVLRRVRADPPDATPWAVAVVGRAELALGNEARARELFERLARDDFADPPRNIRWISSVVEIAMLGAELEDSARAERLLALLETAADQHGAVPVPIAYGGPISRCMGHLCRVLGHEDEARDHLEAALAAVERLGALPMRARVQLELAAASTRRADAERRRALLEQSAETARQLGMRRVLERAEGLLASR